MPEVRNYTYDHTELAEILIKKLDLREGLWGIYIEFGLVAANVATSQNDPKTIQPASISFVQKIGVQRFDEPSNLTVDAAKVNPTRVKKKR